MCRFLGALIKFCRDVAEECRNRSMGYKILMYFGQSLFFFNELPVDRITSRKKLIPCGLRTGFGVAFWKGIHGPFDNSD